MALFFSPRSAYGKPLDMDYAVSTTANNLNEKSRTDKGLYSFFGGDGGNRSFASFGCFATLSHLYVRLALPTANRSTWTDTVSTTLLYVSKKKPYRQKSARLFWWRWR